MSEYGTVIEAGALRLERLLPGPIERVWAYLTESEKRRKWLARGEMELHPGGAVELSFLHSELSAEKIYPEKYKKMENGRVSRERIVQCEPPRLLVFTWDGESGTPSEVTLALEVKDEKVLLTLTHRRLKDRSGMVGVAGGWHTHLAILEDLLNEREPRGFWTAHSRAAAEYEARIPQS